MIRRGIGKKKNNNQYTTNYKKYVIWVVRQNSKGELRNAAPCNTCCIALKKLGFRKVVYSEDDGTMIMIDLRRYTNDHLSMTSVYSQSV